MSMSKRHFEAIARLIRSEHEDAQSVEATLVIERLAQRMANVLGGDNPRFDRERFLDACYGPK